MRRMVAQPQKDIKPVESAHFKIQKDEDGIWKLLPVRIPVAALEVIQAGLARINGAGAKLWEDFTERTLCQAHIVGVVVHD